MRSSTSTFLSRAGRRRRHDTHPLRRFAWPGLPGWLLAVGLFAAPLRSPAELQFDVFVGFDDHVRDGNWFPMAFEISNDGPTFTGTVVVGADGDLDTQRRSFAIELPTGTRKRVTIPVFASSRRATQWEAHLLDPKGKVLAERAGLESKTVAAHVPILGALPRTFGGLPALPDFKEQGRSPEFQPAVARLQSDFFPANPLALEAMTACYLNSEKAAELKPDQVDALLAWLHNGGHLIVGIEAPTDVNALPWLRGLMPFVPNTLTNLPNEGCFEKWLLAGRPELRVPPPVPRPQGTTSRNRRPGRVAVQAPADANPEDPFTQLPTHADFNNAEVPILTGRHRDGTIVLSLGDFPLVVSAPRGRGTLSALAFSPEREPFRSWNNRAWFWAKLISVPPDLLAATGAQRWGGTSIDSLFGAMLDSRQVRKLPVAALLLLLVVYLGVIGPFDQWILRRTGKQMWTWVTFPTYVVLFSGLIYFIGYRLRAGDLEWNELQVIDQLPRGEDSAALRGRTWFSIYSPANARYRLASSQTFTALRPEYEHLQGVPGRGDSARLNQRLPARGFEADADVPVWVNQLYTSDWLEAGSPLIACQVSADGSAVHVVLENQSQLRFDAVQLVVAGRLLTLQALAPGQRLELDLDLEQGSLLDELLANVPNAIQRAQQRRSAFGDASAGHLNRELSNVILASFTERVAGRGEEGQNNFIAPAAFDLNPLLERGEAVLFAWASGQAVAQPIQRFSPKRSQRDTVVRLALPVNRPS